MVEPKGIEPSNVIGMGESVVEVAVTGRLGNSPNKVRMTLRQLDFFEVNGGPDVVPLDTCVVTYDRSLGSASTLLDCPYEIEVGEAVVAVMVFKFLQEPPWRN